MKGRRITETAGFAIALGISTAATALAALASAKGWASSTDASTAEKAAVAEAAAKAGSVVMALGLLAALAGATALALSFAKTNADAGKRRDAFRFGAATATFGVGAMAASVAYGSRLATIFCAALAVVGAQASAGARMNANLAERGKVEPADGEKTVPTDAAWLPVLFGAFAGAAAMKVGLPSARLAETMTGIAVTAAAGASIWTCLVAIVQGLLSKDGPAWRLAGLGSASAASAVFGLVAAGAGKQASLVGAPALIASRACGGAFAVAAALSFAGAVAVSRAGKTKAPIGQE